MVNVTIFYKNSGFTPSKLYYSNIRHTFRMNKALPPLRTILHLRKNSKSNAKGAYYSVN